MGKGFPLPISLRCPVNDYDTKRKGCKVGEKNIYRIRNEDTFTQVRFANMGDRLALPYLELSHAKTHSSTLHTKM